jgi:hypothetical protein
MARLEEDPVLYAAVTIAADDGVSVAEVFNRGAFDLALRIARRQMK